MRNVVESINRRTNIRAKSWIWIIALLACFVPAHSSAQALSKLGSLGTKTTCGLSKLNMVVSTYFHTSSLSMSVRSINRLRQTPIYTTVVHPNPIHIPDRLITASALVAPAQARITPPHKKQKTKKAAGRREAAIQPIELNIEGIYTKHAPYTNETLKRLHIDPNVPELEVTPRNPVFTHPSGSPTLPFSEKIQQHSRANADTKEKIAEFYSSIGKVLQDETKIKSIRQHMKNFQHFLMLEELKFIDLKLKDKIKRNRHRINSQDTDFVLKAYILIYDDYDEYFRHTAA